MFLSVKVHVKPVFKHVQYGALKAALKVQEVQQETQSVLV